MKAHEILFAFGYMLNRKLDPDSRDPEWVSCLGMSLMLGLNLIALSVVAAIITGNRDLVVFRNIYGFAIFPLLWAIGYFLFIKEKRFLAVMQTFEKLSNKTKSTVFWAGLIYIGLTILTTYGSLAVLGGVIF